MTSKRPNHRPLKDLTTSKKLNDEFYTINEVADILKVHHNTIRRAIKRGQIKAVFFGNKWLINKDQLNKDLRRSNQ